MDVNVISDAMTDFKNYKKNLPDDRSKNIVFSRFGYDAYKCYIYISTLTKMLESSGAKIIDKNVSHRLEEVGVINAGHRELGNYCYGGGIEIRQCKAEFKVDYDE